VSVSLTSQENRPSLPEAISKKGILQRKCHCGQNTSANDACPECKKNKLQLQRKPASSSSTTEVSPLVNDVLNTSGQPLDSSTRNFMESRFGREFSHVRVHTDTRAARSARSVNALAYTVGNDIAFDNGQYSPGTNKGKRLLAHELTHVLQQNTHHKSLSTKLSMGNSTDAAERQADDVADAVVHGAGKVPSRIAPAMPSVQRACGVTDIGTRTECDDQDPVFVTGQPAFKFNSNCDDFAPGEETNLFITAATLSATGPVEIHGYASVDGNATFNENLSCARALKARTVLTSAGITAGRISVIKHGPTPGPAADRRSVVISSPAAPGPTPPTPTPTPTPAAVITSETVATAPGARTRTDIGVGEEVNLTFSAGSATWATTAGTLSATTGATVTLTAPDTAQHVGIGAVGGGRSANLAFSVLAPNGVHRDRLPGSGIKHTLNFPDSGIQTESFLLPDTVNFGNTEYHEVDSPAATSGTYSCHSGVSHDPSPSTIPVADTVVTGKGSGPNGRDQAYSGHCGGSSPFTPGSLSFVIPYEYRVGTGPFRRFATVIQMHTLANDASRLTSDKAGAHGETTVAAATSTF